VSEEDANLNRQSKLANYKLMKLPLLMEVLSKIFDLGFTSIKTSSHESVCISIVASSDYYHLYMSLMNHALVI
jgi:hypothetical protein